MHAPFPLINTLADLLPHIADKPEIRVNAGPEGSTVVCYQFQGSKTFDNAYAAECRGLVFDRDGTICARPLHKFFNLGEKPNAEQDPLEAVRVMEKRDGSMIHTVWLHGKLVLKSKKAFQNSQVEMANHWLGRPENLVALGFCEQISERGYTVIFELTSPSNRIVVSYEKTEMTLLHIRKNDTGEYFDKSMLQTVADKFGIPLVDDNELFGCSEVVPALASLADLEGAEGYVFQFANGDMLKAKGAWYLQLHRTLSFTRERDIAEAALDERLDDIKSALTATGVDLKAVNAIENEVMAVMLATQRRIEDTVAGDLNLDRKEFAIKHKGADGFGLLMALFNGKEPDYRHWFRQHVLKQVYSLDPVGVAYEEY